MKKEHNYELVVQWTGNKGSGTSDYTEYERSHSVFIKNKPEMHCSSDGPFRGDTSKYNPEDLLLAALSSCHMLWFLHLCADAGIIVMEYSDHAKGRMIQKETGGGHFKSVTLNPRVIITDASLINKANALHTKANQQCFIANSMNFAVDHNPICTCAT